MMPSPANDGETCKRRLTSGRGEYSILGERRLWMKQLRKGHMDSKLYGEFCSTVYESGQGLNYFGGKYGITTKERACRWHSIGGHVINNVPDR